VFKQGITLLLFVILSTNFSFSATLAQQLMEMSDVNQHTESAMMKVNKNMVEIQPTKLTDVSGLVYVGGIVEQNKIQPYLTQMQAELGDKFSTFRGAQIKRDHGKFHITLVNPFELKKLNDNALHHLLNNTQPISFKIKGLGKVENKDGAAYFIVAQSFHAQDLREKLGLNAKDFHITLGFYPKDIHGVAKDETMLIK